MRQSGLQALDFTRPATSIQKSVLKVLKASHAGCVSSLCKKALLPNHRQQDFLRVRIHTSKAAARRAVPSRYVHEPIRSHNSQPPVNWLTASDAENRPAAAGRISRPHLQHKTARSLCAKRWELELSHKAHATRRFRTQLLWSPPPKRPRCRRPTPPSSARKTRRERCYQNSSTRAALRNNSNPSKEGSSSRAAAPPV